MIVIIKLKLMHHIGTVDLSARVSARCYPSVCVVFFFLQVFRSATPCTSMRSDGTSAAARMQQ